MKTMTRVSTHVHTFSRCCTFVADRLIEMAVRITKAHDVREDNWADRLDVLLRGPRTWLLMRQLKAMILEIYNGNELVLKYEFPIVNLAPRSSSKEFFSDQVQVIAKQAEDLRVEATRYRIICDTTEGAETVPGWSPSQLADDSHLKKKKLADNAIETNAIRVEAYLHLKGDSNERSI